jgi:hypothetical protein
MVTMAAVPATTTVPATNTALTTSAQASDSATMILDMVNLPLVSRARAVFGSNGGLARLAGKVGLW